MPLTALEMLQSYFQTFLISIAILLIGFSIGILARKLISRLFQEIRLNKQLTQLGITVDVERWVSLLISITIYLFTLLFFLEYLQIRSIVLYLLLGGVLVLIILTTLVGLKDFLPNLAGWLHLRKKLKIGRLVTVQEITGTVEHLGYLETRIRTRRRDLLYVPNSLLLKSASGRKKS